MLKYSHVFKQILSNPCNIRKNYVYLHLEINTKVYDRKTSYYNRSRFGNSDA